MLTVEIRPCGETPDGEMISQYVMTNAHGMQVNVINFGGIITSVESPDRHGKMANVTLGFSAAWNDYFENCPYFGGICGRYANRISKAKFTLRRQGIHTLSPTMPPNHLHGGNSGFMKRVWQAETVDSDKFVGVELDYISPDGEEGYPGDLVTSVVYTLNDDNELLIDYTATFRQADRPESDEPCLLESGRAVRRSRFSITN